jgi:hypothetical protein
MARKRASNKVRQPPEMGLAEIRRLAGFTQVEVAPSAGFDQSEVSKLERRSDYLVSTLRRYFGAMGGKVEILVHVGGHTVRLKES